MRFTVMLPIKIVVLFVLLALALFGCGEKTVVSQDGTKTEQSQACIDCHQNVISPVTGAYVVEEWKLSRHNTSNAAGCADCHEPEAGHPTGCNLCHGGTPTGATVHVSNNPDRDTRCYKCHGAVTGLFPTGSRTAHFRTSTFPVSFANYSASYVSTNYLGNCRKCHNPHDTTSNIAYNRAWAKSGHGETNTGPRTVRDFKLYGTSQPANLAYINSSPTSTTDPAVIATGTPVCVRCHTTTGYLQFVDKNNFLTVTPFGSNVDKTKEVTGCDACHTNYAFERRNVGKVTIYYNFSGATQSSPSNLAGHAKIQNNAVTFPDLKTSNMCVPCHSGRGLGSVVSQLSALGVDFTKLNSPSSHDFPGAAILTVNNMNAKSGYQFAGKEYITGVGSNTGHDTFGVSSGKGPCISCHMSKLVKSDSHTFKPVIHGSSFALYTTNRSWSQVFSVSNSNLFPASLTISAITSQSCNTTGCHIALDASALTNDKEGFISALAVLNKWVRLVRNVPKNPSAALGTPVYDSVKKTLTYPNAQRSSTNWIYLGANTGPDLMGSAYNLSMLNNEPGAYVHNPLYVKRLVYDSIQFISSLAPDIALGANRYPVDTPIFTNVADAIYYLLTTTAETLETGPEYLNGGLPTGVNTTIKVVAKIPKHQADAAILWLYGKKYSDLSPSDKLKRPGE